MTSKNVNTVYSPYIVKKHANATAHSTRAHTHTYITIYYIMKFIFEKLPIYERLRRINTHKVETHACKYLFLLPVRFMLTCKCCYLLKDGKAISLSGASPAKL